MPETAVVKFEEFALAKPDAAQAISVIQENAGQQGISEFDLDRIKVPAGGGTSWALTTLDGEQSVTEFDALVILYKDARMYWSKAFDEGGSEPPDCHSDDCVTGVGDPGGDCKVCPYAEFESASRGHGQACKQVRSLFLLRQEELLPAILTLPPTSLAPCRSYFMRLASRSVPYYGVITRFSLERVKNQDNIAYGRVKMAPSGRLTADQLAHMSDIRGQLVPQLQRSRARVQNTESAENTEEPDANL